MEGSVRKVLSFDVGIKNLAYCLMNIDDKTKRFDIKNWGIINLADNRKLCCFIKKSGEVCSKIANSVVKIDQYNTYYYCKEHVSKAELKILPVVLSWWPVPDDEIDKCSLCTDYGCYYVNMLEGQYCQKHRRTIMENHHFICTNKKCVDSISKGLYLNRPEYDSDGVEDGDFCYELAFGWCDKHYKEEYKDFLKKKTRKLSQNSNKIPLTSLGSSMYEKLDEIPELLQVDDILVENQPTFINPTMKSVSAILFSYFIMRGIHERKKTHSTIKNINFCSPSNKIKVGGKKASGKIEKTSTEKVYKITKNLGVKFCKALIKDNKQWLETIEAYKKQDDMADAFLQAFIMNFGPTLPDYYAEMIKHVDVNDTNDVNDVNDTDNVDNRDVQEDVCSDKNVSYKLRHIPSPVNSEEDDFTIKIGRKEISLKKDKVYTTKNTTEDIVDKKDTRKTIKRRSKVKID